MGEAERNASLVSANSALKTALMRARQQCLHAELLLGSLNATLSTALGLPGNQADPKDSEQANETSAHPNPGQPSSMVPFHSIQESIEHQIEPSLDSGPSEWSETSARASTLRPNQDDPFNICNFMDFDLAVPSLPESFSVHSQSKSPPSMEASQLGKSKIQFKAISYLHMFPAFDS